MQPPAHVNPVELYDRQQQEARAEFGANKGLQAMSDMKKRLEAFKAAKNVNQNMKSKSKSRFDQTTSVRSDSPDIIEVNDNSQFRWDNTEALEERAMTPLDLMRKYVKLHRKIDIRDGKVFFRELSFPAGLKTRLRISRQPGEEPDHYTVGCLAFFVLHLTDDHPEYVRKCICDKVQCVRRVDRDNVQQYLTGVKDFVLNLDSGAAAGAGVTEYGGDITDTGSRSSRTRDSSRDRERRRSRSRSTDRRGGSRETRSRNRTRSRSRDRDRSRRSGDRERGRRSRSRSRDSRHRHRSGEDRAYNPANPTVSPTRPPQMWSEPPRSMLDPGQREGFGLSQGPGLAANSRMMMNGFDQRSGFDQRPGPGPGTGGGGGGMVSRSGFDQRPVSSERSGFDQRLNNIDGRSGFDQRSGNFDGRPAMSEARSGFDQRPNTLDGGRLSEGGSGFDQRPNNMMMDGRRSEHEGMSVFDQRSRLMMMEEQNMFNARMSERSQVQMREDDNRLSSRQEMDLQRGAIGVRNPDMEDAMMMRSQQQWNRDSSGGDSLNQRMTMSERLLREREMQHAGNFDRYSQFDGGLSRGTNFRMENDDMEYDDSNRSFMNSGSQNRFAPEQLRVDPDLRRDNMPGSSNDGRFDKDEEGDGEGGDGPGGGTSLGPMFVIGQKSGGGAGTRRW